MSDLFGQIFSALGSGLPPLLGHALIAVVLLAIGMAIYVQVTPFHERPLIAKGNCAAGITMAGAIIAMAVPLAAMLATSRATVDIVVWGIVAVVLQLVAFLVVAMLLKNLRRMIEDGNLAAAFVLAGVQLAVALLNAGAMAG
jgi:putative membrane protein